MYHSLSLTLLGVVFRRKLKGELNTYVGIICTYINIIYRETIKKDWYDGRMMFFSFKCLSATQEIT